MMERRGEDDDNGDQPPQNNPLLKGFTGDGQVLQANYTSPRMPRPSCFSVTRSTDTSTQVIEYSAPENLHTIKNTGRILAEEVSNKPTMVYIQFTSPINRDFSVLFPGEFSVKHGSKLSMYATIMLDICNGGLNRFDVPITKTLGRDGNVEIILEGLGLICAEYVSLKEEDVMLFDYKGGKKFKVNIYDWETLSAAEIVKNAIDINRQNKATSSFVDGTPVYGKAKTNIETPTAAATQQLLVYGSERPIAEDRLSDIDQQGTAKHFVDATRVQGKENPYSALINELDVHSNTHQQKPPNVADVNFNLEGEGDWDDLNFSIDNVSDFGLLGEENFDPADFFLTSPTSPLVTLDHTLPPLSNEPHPTYHLLNSDPYPTFIVPEHSAQAAALPTPLQPRADARDRELEESLSEQQPRAGGRDRTLEETLEQLHPAEASPNWPLILTQSRELDQFNVLNEAKSYEQMLDQPACTVVLKKTFLSNLRLPAKFIEVVKKATAAHLIVENGENGLASCGIKKYNSNGLYLGKGWRSFVDANLLKQGDACVFEFVGEDIDKGLVQFRVAIFRGR